MTIAQRMRDAAKVLEEISSLYGYRHPDEAGWSAHELRNEAKQLESTTPHPLWDNCSGACANLEDPA